MHLTFLSNTASCSAHPDSYPRRALSLPSPGGNAVFVRLPFVCPRALARPATLATESCFDSRTLITTRIRGQPAGGHYRDRTVGLSRALSRGFAPFPQILLLNLEQLFFAFDSVATHRDDERYCRRYHPAPSALWPRTGLPASRQASHHNHGSVQASIQDGAVGQVPRAADIRRRQEGIIQKQGHGLPPGPPEETAAVTGQFDRLRAARGRTRLPRLHPNPHPHPLRSASELRGEVTRTRRCAPGHSVWPSPSLRHATNVFRL